MNKKIIYTAIAICVHTITFAQVTKVGNDTLLDVAGWNVEWFGDATSGNGPSDEALQYANVKAILKNTDIDVWGLAEVSNPTTFSALLTDLATYDGVLSSFSQTQKTALIWKKSKFDVISYGNVLTESTYSYDFASRPPLEVALKSKDNNITDTLYFYVLHLKANSSGDNTSNYNRRKNAVGFLKTFLDTNRKGKKCFVLGDWNDDVDQSVVYGTNAYLETPFANFVNDSARYFFTTMALAKAGDNSYVSSQNMIDQQMITRYVKDSFYLAGSSLVMKATAAQVSGYANNTSDHYPVLSRYNMKRYFKPTPPQTGLAEDKVVLQVLAYPNPASQVLHIETSFDFKTVKLVNMLGAAVTETTDSDLDISTFENGMYVLQVSGEAGTAILKLLIQH